MPSGAAAARTGDASSHEFARQLAALERGAGAVVTGSGAAALNLLLSGLEPGSPVIAPADCFGSTRRLLCERRNRRQLDISFIDATDRIGLRSAVEFRRPTLILVESPGSALLGIADIRTAAACATSMGAKLAVDNTLLSPAVQRPIELGADYVYHTALGQISGYGQCRGGAVVARTPEDAAALSAWAQAMGIEACPLSSQLALPGLATLPTRAARQQASAAVIAGFLDRHPRIAMTFYPGLPGHPGHATAASQQDGFGPVIAARLAGGRRAAHAVIEALELFQLSDAPGGSESCIAHPATMGYGALPETERSLAGVDEGLLRLAIGLEEPALLQRDLENALRVAG
jgi:cystathionine gamma-synthase